MQNAHAPFALLSSCLLALLGSACSSSSRAPASEWPPADFRLLVEEVGPCAEGPLSTKRFTVTADGTCVYARSLNPVVDPETGTMLPVFDTLCAYRLRPECTRLLARKLEQRGVRALDAQQGTGGSFDSKSIRVVHRAFGHDTRLQATGQVHGGFVRVLHVVNAWLPSSERFDMPGMTGDSEPENLGAVPAPVQGVAAALAFVEERLQQDGEDQDLLLDAFALACRVGDRARSEALMGRWAAAAHQPATPDAPFFDPPRLGVDVLRRMLPE